MSRFGLSSAKHEHAGGSLHLIVPANPACVAVLRATANSPENRFGDARRPRSRYPSATAGHNQTKPHCRPAGQQADIVLDTGLRRQTGPQQVSAPVAAERLSPGRPHAVSAIGMMTDFSLPADQRRGIMSAVSEGVCRWWQPRHLLRPVPKQRIPRVVGWALVSTFWAH